MSKRILYLSDYQLLAYQAKGKTLTEIQQFQLSANGEVEFVNYLTADPKTPILWLIDTTQEEYQTSRLPHVFGKDRRDLLSHKMKRLFDYTPYAHADFQGRETHGRGDDRVLFMALNNPTLLQPWLNLILTHKVPLTGIVSVPLLSQRLLNYLPKASYTLLVAHTPAINEHSPAGLRQSFFADQYLQLSRLIPLTTLTPSEYAEYVFNQIIKTQRYLESARKLSLEVAPSLSVVILTDTSLIDALVQYPKENLSGLQVHILDGWDLARQLGWHPEVSALYLHHLVAYQLSHSRGLGNHYAQSTETRYFFYRQVRMMIYLASALLLAGALTLSQYILNHAWEVKHEGQKIDAETQKLMVKLQGILGHASDVKQADDERVRRKLEDIERVRSVVDMGLYIKSFQLPPRPTWTKVSHVLTRHPNLLIEELEWNINETTATESKDSPSQSSGSKSSSAPPKDVPDHFFEVIRLHGKMDDFGGNYQNALRSFEKFVADLRNDFSQVKELQSPYKATSMLQGQLGSQPTKEGNAPYAVEIVIEHSPKKPSPSNLSSSPKGLACQSLSLPLIGQSVSPAAPAPLFPKKGSLFNKK